ncbi:MAG: response regulator, partial [Desulfobacteraceae bacterium]|nr:response regulator [Desulfobacteraceae bacterium]
MTEAKDGKEAILNIKEIDFNLIMLDLLMPGMDGFETAKIIREMGMTIPIVAVSALTLKQDRQRSLSAGCNDFLPKPLNIKKLRLILKKYIKKNTPQEQKTTLPSVHKEFLISSAEAFKGLNLILVEENEQLRKSYAHFLSQAGFRVQELANGSEASKFIENPDNNVNIIISNIFTSGVDGLGLLTIVKRKFAHILVILYTESYDTSTFQYAVQQRVDGIIPQDQFKTAALEIIESALSQSRLKGSRASEANTAQMVRKAQAQLIHPGCINLCPSLDVAYQSLHEAGGDMIRCHRLGLEGQCGIVLSDVAGHNVMSSYTSAIFTGILTSFWDSHK